MNVLLEWRFYVKLGLFTTILDGALRKWFFPGSANIIYFLKDVIFLAAYVLFLIQNGRRGIMPEELRFIRPVLTLAVLMIFMQGFNPRLGSVFVGVIGIRNYLIYAPLVFLVPRMFRSKEELQQFLWIYGLTMIPVGLLGVLQFISPPSARINAYVGEEATITAFGQGKARITGTFSYISGYNTYLTVIFGILLSMATTIGGSKKRKFLLYGAMSLCVMNMLMTGSRLPVFSAIILIVFYIGMMFVYSQKAFRRMLPSLVLAAIVFLVGVAQSPAYISFLDRLNSSDTQGDVRLKPSTYFEDFFNVFRYDKPGGWGAGAYHPATRALRQSFHLSSGEPTIELEDETDRVLAEIGVLGFIFWYGLRAAIGLLLWMVFLKMRDSSLRNIALSSLALHLLMLPGQLVFQHTAGVYYWFLAGFGALLPRLQIMEDRRAEEAQMLEEQEDEFQPDDDEYYGIDATPTT